MSAKKLKLDIENISCPICLDLLKDLVTIPCGHTYCMNCVNTSWDGSERRLQVPSVQESLQTKAHVGEECRVGRTGGEAEGDWIPMGSPLLRWTLRRAL